MDDLALVLDPEPVCHDLNPEAISPVPDLAVPALMVLATTTTTIIIITLRAASVGVVVGCEAVRMLDAAAVEVQLVWADPPLVRISAPEAPMAVSVETETRGRWVPAVDVDVWPNVANGEDQQEPARMVPAAEDPDVPCRGNKSDGILYMEGRNLHVQMVERVPYVVEESNKHFVVILWVQIPTIRIDAI